MSNLVLLEWYKYLKIPIKEVMSRDHTVPHDHRQVLFIYNLEPSYMSGSHWVATCVKDGVINYFDSFYLHFKRLLIMPKERILQSCTRTIRYRISIQRLAATSVYTF